MRKILWLVVACIFALGLVSVSNVSALGLNKIQDTEWLVSMTFRWYTSEGDYDGAVAGGDAIMEIGEPGHGVFIAAVPMVNSLTGWGLGSQGVIDLYEYTYNPTKNLLKSTSGFVGVFFDGVPSYEGDLIAKITFSSSKAFTGSIVIVEPDGYRWEISLKGKKLGKWTGPS